MRSFRIAETPVCERPRERLESLGPAALTVVELLAILLGTGSARRGVVEAAGELLAEAGGSIRSLSRMPAGVLAGVPGIGTAKAARVAAALELGRRMGTERHEFGTQIRAPADIFRICAKTLRDLTIEEFRLLCLDTQNRVRQNRLVTRGILNGSLVHPREVFRAAVVDAAAGIVVVHNHPSGDPTPSEDDRVVTRQLVEAGRIMSIPLFDHVIVGADSYFSFAEANLL